MAFRIRARHRDAAEDLQSIDAEGANDIVHNDIRLVQATTGYGGQLFVDSTCTINCNRITWEGDRYLDLDPGPASAARPTTTENEITVIIKEAQLSEQGTLLELRALDYDCGTDTNPGC